MDANPLQPFGAHVALNSAWRPATNGSKARHWFLFRDAERLSDQYLYDSRGRLRRFGSFKAAAKIADKLNATD